MKNDVHEKIKYIETTFEVQNIKYKDIVLWPYIRTLLFGKYEVNEAQQTNTNNQQSICNRIKTKIGYCFRLLQSILSTDFLLFFKKQSNFIFTDSLETRIIDGKPISKIEAGVINEIKDVIPVYQVINGSKKAFKHYINNNFINFIIDLKCKTCKVNTNNLVGINIYNSICKELAINVDIISLIKNILVSKQIYSRIFKRQIPKKVFVNCYYDIRKISMIDVAKEYKIPVIEMQHGLITKGHLAYESYKKIHNSPYADYLFCFGAAFKKFVSESIYSKNQIKVVGSFYIDFIRKRQDVNKQLFEKKYSDKIKGKIIITVASQWTIDKQLLDFYIKLAKKNKDLFIIFKVRPFEKYHKEYLNILPNFTIELELDTYICMQNSDIVSTVNSTCAVEALAFGVPVLLIDIDKLATATMKPMFGDSIESVEYAVSLSEAENLIKKLNNLEKDKVLNEGNFFFANYHNDLIRKELQSI